MGPEGCRGTECCRAVGRSENPGVPVFYEVDIICPLVEIGLTDLPKSGGAMAQGKTLSYKNCILLIGI